jgi:hypothetical protein
MSPFVSHTNPEPNAGPPGLAAVAGILSLIRTTEGLTWAYIDSSVVSRSLTEPNTEADEECVVVLDTAVVVFDAEVVVVEDGLRQPVKAPTIIKRPATINSFFFILITPYIIFLGFD